MSANVSASGRGYSLVRQVKNWLFFSVGTLILCLVLACVVTLSTSMGEHASGEQKAAIHDDINGILISMINQETGLRGYIATNNDSFLAPFNDGRQSLFRYIQHLQDETGGTEFNATAVVLTRTVDRADAWYSSYALVQIQEMQKGDFVIPRSVSALANGKTLFGNFRTLVADLQIAADRDLDNLQTQIDRINVAVVAGAGMLTLLAVVTLWRTFSRFGSSLRGQFNTLSTATSRLRAGDLTTRIAEPGEGELGLLAENFNSMVNALEQQQNALIERDVLENVLQLSTELSGSLDLRAMAQGFLSRLLNSIDLHLGAIYLYDQASQKLSLLAAEGFSFSDLTREFQLGEGSIGRVALSRRAVYICRPADDEVRGFRAKTVMGVALPNCTYQVPLIHAEELSGVLSVGTLALMIHERECNVLNVIATNLAAAISNSQAYQRIQEQAREQERMNEELRRQRNGLEQLNDALQEANQARSQFFSTMSHELRTPLASIIGFSQVTLRDQQSANLSQRQRTDIQRILRNGQHLLTMIDEVLDLIRLDMGKMSASYRVVDLQKLITEIFHEVQATATEKNRTLEFAIEEGLSQITTDEARLRQILLHLVSNALKFTKQGGVTVAVSQAAGGGEMQGTPGAAISIAVIDTGIGIAPEHQERIFESFYQVESEKTRQYEGTGLGLALARQLATFLGGTLAVESHPGEGSTFTLTLPVSATTTLPDIQRPRLHDALPVPPADPSEQPEGDSIDADLAEMLDELAEARREETTGRESQCLIVAVDDNPDTLALVKIAMEHTAYKIIGVRDPLKGIDLISILHPDIVILDVQMPKMNGWQVLHHLKENSATAHIPVIFLTVYPDSDTGYVMGADEYLIKPVERGTLLRAIQRFTPEGKVRTKIQPGVMVSAAPSITERPQQR